MNPIYEKLQRCYKSVKEKVDFTPDIALVLGSGLGDFVSEIDVKYTLNYNDIEGFPVSTVAGHKGQFIFGHINDIPLVAMQGRVHYYEGYPMSDVVLPTRLMKLLGAKVLFLTNAAGGIVPEFKAGDFMLINDQISSFVPSPLIGENIEELGTRFPDMTNIYDNDLQDIIRNTAKELKIDLKEGVYLQLSGPAYESPAEINLCRMLGASAVGMSTTCEAVAANHMNMKICGISFISNLAAGLSETKLSHKEVQESADVAAPAFKKLVKEAIIKIAEGM